MKLLLCTSLGKGRITIWSTCSLSLYFCKRLFSRFEHVTSYSHDNNSQHCYAMIQSRENHTLKSQLLRWESPRRYKSMWDSSLIPCNRIITNHAMLCISRPQRICLRTILQCQNHNPRHDGWWVTLISLIQSREPRNQLLRWESPRMHKPHISSPLNRCGLKSHILEQDHNSQGSLSLSSIKCFRIFNMRTYKSFST